jgi:dCTP deaminase
MYEPRGRLAQLGERCVRNAEVGGSIPPPSTNCYHGLSSMVLSDVDIKRYIELGKIKISPNLPADQFGSCSVDFRLGTEFNVFEHSRYPYIDLKSKTALEGIMRSVVVEPGEPFILQPREFVLAITEEKLELDSDVLGRLEGRSSLGRIGIIVHGTAGLFDPGWSGKATLELSNLGRMPVALYPGMRICSFTFEQLSSPSAVPYRTKPNNKYAGQTGPLASRLDREVGEVN